MAGKCSRAENVIQSAIILATGDTIAPEDLPEALQALEPADLESTVPGGSFEEQLRGYRVRLATKAIEESNGNKTLAARSLNIFRAYLHRLIREGEEQIVAG
jgi:DNA-binding NtrC family response regulator